MLWSEYIEVTNANQRDEEWSCAASYNNMD